ncbi:Ndr family protein [Sphaerisporangium melleum]|uniref:Ndr family protein n=1 Tax=Sphaerisporangium melleum TaxID=321316 RepID=A0A917VPX0_9ACTN|nr:alpha/beta hydrolase [Sphaerisporangium melleum]GGL02790.1 Ndr family protein [Sphaerisporangium melleum]GII69479.1 Ndr family protein [Sphaerisporangium melleum]
MNTTYTSAVYTSEEGARAVEQEYRYYLERWPVPNEQVHVPTREGDTFVVACGPADAPPLVLLHGSGANSSSWIGDVGAWSRHFRLYAVDMIGEPGLSAPSRPPLASGAYENWLDDVLDGLGLARVSMVGISLGGWMASRYASHRPGRVERMALLCPGGIGRQKYQALLIWLLLRPFGRWGRRVSMRAALGPMEPPSTPEARRFADYFMLVSENVKYRQEPLPVLDDAGLRRLTMPMLVLLGGRDGLLDSAGTQRRLRAAAPHARIDLRPEVGHLIVGRTRQILDFLREDAATPDPAPEGAGEAV